MSGSICDVLMCMWVIIRSVQIINKQLMSTNHSHKHLNRKLCLPYLDPSCNKYCNLIGQEEVHIYKLHARCDHIWPCLFYVGIAQWNACL